MKHLYTSLFLLLTISLSAQIPDGYYDSATGTGAELKTNLSLIISTNINSSAPGASYGDLWTLYTQPAFEDNYYDHDGTIVDLYTEKPTLTDVYSFTPISDQCGSSISGEGDCYNREHIIPKSYFGGTDAYPMYSDAYFVFPSDGYVNGKHNNYPYGEVGSATYTSTNGSKLGSGSSSSGYSGTVFEPIDEFKGDVARAYFYFVTRYESDLINFYDTYTSTEVRVMFDGLTFPALNSTFLNILLTWNTLDPVSQQERDKNEAIYTFQGNRNPFIDDNSYVTSIWGSPLSIENFTNLDLKMYPNPLKGSYLTIDSGKTLQVEIYDILGKQVLKSAIGPKGKTLNVGSLRKGIYMVRLILENGSTTKKLIKN